jgi:hypothetical protein
VSYNLGVDEGLGLGLGPPPLPGFDGTGVGDGSMVGHGENGSSEKQIVGDGGTTVQVAVGGNLPPQVCPNG